MAEIAPFRAVRYAASRGHELGQLLAPPYDLVTPAQRDELLRRDPHNIIHVALDEASLAEPAAETDSDDGVHHRLWRAEDPAVVASLVSLLAPQRIFIADGHHRYETALVYSRMLDEQTPGLPADGGHHYTLMFLCPMNDPGLFLFATHRLVFGLKDFSLSAFLEKLSRWFRIET